MTTRTRHLRPLVQAHKRRSTLPAYFDLSGKGLFLLVVVGASLLGLLALVQAGRVVSVGYQLKDLQQEEAQLRWDKEGLLGQIATAADPATLEVWAKDKNMKRVQLEDVTFIPIPRELNISVQTTTTVVVQPEGRLP